MSQSKILVVEDDPASRRLLEIMLRRQYRVMTAASGDEALSIAAAQNPDMVLLDIEMPGMDGFQTLEQLRAGIIDHAVPVIFLTARADTESRDKGLEAGAVDYLIKPYDRTELSIKVKNHLALFTARKELEGAHRVMAQEMEMASQLQRSLLPQEFPRDERVNFSVMYIPSSTASGDFYDLVEIPGNRVGFVQVDVSGHGVRSAIIGAMFKMAFRTRAASGASPSVLLSQISEEMFQLIPDTDFLTVFCGFIDMQSLELVYCNAGHPRPFLYRRDTGQVAELSLGGTLLGAFAGMKFEEGAEQLKPGDKILLYTDGATEAHRSEYADLYGTDRLKRLFVENISADPQVILDAIVSGIRSFQAREAFDDDVSLLVVSIE